MKVFWFVLLATFVNVSANDGNVLERLKSGFKFAGDFFKVDHIRDVTKLVSDAFQKGAGNVEQKKSDDVFSTFLRILGFDTKKIGAITINALIFLTQLINSSLGSTTAPKAPRTDKETKEENPFDWIISDIRVSKLMDNIKNDDLSANIISYIKEHSLDEETDCVQLLICKLSPFVKSMQRALSSKQVVKGKKALFEHLPTKEDVETASENCERHHPYCNIIY